MVAPQEPLEVALQAPRVPQQRHARVPVVQGPPQGPHRHTARREGYVVSVYQSLLPRKKGVHQAVELTACWDVQKRYETSWRPALQARTLQKETVRCSGHFSQGPGPH